MVRTYLEQVWGDAAARFTIAAENLPPKRAPTKGRPPKGRP